MLTFCRLYVCMKQYIQYFTARIYSVPSNTWSFNLINHQKCKCTSGCLPLLLSIESSLIRQETARRKEKTTKKYFNWNPDFNSDLPSKVYSASITRWVLQTEVELLQITSKPRPKKEIRKISQFFELLTQDFFPEQKVYLNIFCRQRLQVQVRRYFLFNFQIFSYFR